MAKISKMMRRKNEDKHLGDPILLWPTMFFANSQKKSQLHVFAEQFGNFMLQGFQAMVTRMQKLSEDVISWEKVLFSYYQNVASSRKRSHLF